MNKTSVRFKNLNIKHPFIKYPGFIIATLVVVQLLFSATVNAQIDLAGWSNHWAYEHMVNAVNQGWCELQPNFNPDKEISRSELVEMLLRAVKIVPGGVTANFLSHVSTNADEDWFSDISNHRIATEGWLKTALNFGLVLPSDYPDNMFHPASPVSRRECILMIDRAIGRVYPATLYTQGGNLFTDFASLPGWFKGFVSEAVNFDLIIGYPDGSVRAGKNITFAEAITAVDRTVKELNQGIDTNIQVLVTNTNNTNTITLDLPVPAQIINQKIYVPVRSIFEGGKQLYNTPDLGFIWRPSDQILEFEYGVTFQFESGNIYYGFYNALLPEEDEYNSLPGEARLLNGEVMVPLIFSGQSANLRFTDEKNWDQAAKRLTVRIDYPHSPLS